MYMKKMFSCILISLLFLPAANLRSQECTYYFPAKQGSEIEMKSYSDKDKVTSISKSKVLDVSGNTIKVANEIADDKGKPVAKSEFVVSCKNGEFVMDMSSYLKGVNMDAYKDMDIKVETEDMHMPASLKAGDVLDDGEMTVKVTNQGFPMMNMKVKVYNRKVEKMESITTPAGTFDCAKITYDIDSKVVFAMSLKAIEWVSKNVGVVRSESYNSKGKLQGYTLLTGLK
jgi:hypothetical protein